MSKLSQRREQAEAKFNELVKTREQKQSELTDLDAELNRLQGEYRLLNEMEAEEAPAKAHKGNNEASTIDATPAEEAK